MSRAVLTAVSHRHEGDVVRTLDQVPGLTVVRRCADLADLLAAASSGIGRVALVSADLRGLDRTALDRLRGHGLSVVGMYPPSDEAAELRLRQLGVAVVLATDATGAEISDGVERALADADPTSPGAAEPGARRAADPGPAGAAEPFDLGALYDPYAVRDDGAHAGDRDDGAGGRDPDAPGEVVAVWGPTGAPGRSTVAVNLAAELAAFGEPTVLVDADTYGACVAQALSLLDEAPGLAAAARASDHGTLDLPALARLAPEVTPRLRVLTGIPKAERWPELRAPALADVFDLTRRLARYVVVDCGFGLEDDEELSYDTLAPRRNATTLTALETADRVLAVGAGDPIGLQRLVRGLQELATRPVAAPLVVVNKVRAGAVGPRPEERIADALQRFAGVTDARFVPFDLTATDAAQLAGRTLAEVAPGSPARLAIRDLAAALARVDATSARRRSRLRVTR